MLTLIASVQMAAITSSEPPRTRLSSRVGSYSQIAVAFSTAAIFVIWPITSTFPRFTTCPRHLPEDSVQQILEIINKHTAFVVRHYSIQGHDEYGYPQ